MTSEKSLNPDVVWDAVVALWVAVFIFFGGSSEPIKIVNALQLAASLPLLLVALLRLRNGFTTPRVKWAALLAFGCLLLPLLQLIPLPQEIWQNFPSRDFVTNTLNASGVGLGWMPLSMSPSGTLSSASGLLPGVAAFFATLTVSRHGLAKLVIAIVMMAFVGVLIALFQRVGGPDSAFYVYERAIKTPSGLFRNRNFAASHFATALPFVVAMGLYYFQKLSKNGLILALVTAVFVGVFVMGLAVVGSRAGILMSVLAMLLSVFLVRGMFENVSNIKTSKYAIIAVVVALVVLAQTSMVGILSLAKTDTITDMRTVINQQSLIILQNYYPTGTGFGTFVPVYELFETPDVTFPVYINHAHNDWMEIAIEGGIPALILLSLFLVLFLLQLGKIWWPSQNGSRFIFARAGSIAVLVLLAHSAVDYPLRTSAMSVIFAIAMAMMFMELQSSRQRSHSRHDLPPSQASRNRERPTFSSSVKNV